MSSPEVALRPNTDPVSLFIGGPADGMRIAVTIGHEWFEYRPPLPRPSAPSGDASGVEAVPDTRVRYAAVPMRAGNSILRVFVAPELTSAEVISRLIERYPRPTK